MTAIGWWYEAPTGFVLVTLCTTFFCVWFFILGRVSGCRIDQNAFFFFAGKWQQSIPIPEVQTYRRTEWSEGQPWIYLCLRNGSDLLVPAYCIGDVNEFVAVLDGLHIAREP